MYSKHEASLITQQFWTAFGKYMAPVLSAEGEKINWVNYKTGEKDIRFVMSADSKGARVCITLSHSDTGMQTLYFDKFLQFKKVLHKMLGEDWIWERLKMNQHGKMVSEIYTSLQEVNVLNKTDWPGIISFLKARVIALDVFWCEFKYAFERSAF